MPEEVVLRRQAPTSQRSELRAGHWRIDLLERPGGSRSPSQDAALVAPRADGGVRVVALDGVTPMDPARRVYGLDEATFAAGLLRTALTAERPATECLRAANIALHRPTVTPSRMQRQACATVADISPDGRVLLTQAGDCVAFARTGQRAWALLPDDAVGRSKRAQVGELRARRPSFADVEARRAYIEEEAELLEGRDSWRSTAIGRFADPILIERALEAGWDELVLASDGAELSEDRVTTIDAWTDELSSRPADDDITLIRVRRS